MEKRGLEKIFEVVSDALFLLEGDRCIKQNKAADELSDEYPIHLQKILEIAKGDGCMLHSTLEKCLDCEVRADWDQGSFPIILETSAGHQEQFSGSFSQVDEKISLLSIRRIAVEDRLQQMIQNKRLIEYVNQAHENERRALSQELHDGLAQSIYSLMLETRQLKWVDRSECLMDRLQKIDEDFVLLLSEVKQLAVDLRPAALDDLGLIPAIEALLHRYKETTGMDIHFIPVVPNKRFADSLETITYRVLQESVMNSVKYADVDELWVTLSERDHHLMLTVRDHGKGFDPFSVNKNSQGLGLLHMQERAESIGGRLEIQSEKGEGTTIILRLPIRLGEKI
ncbi:sensor histidine kinase [Enterococcus wangshanyuanii]|uniref:Sensor histidine kinase n=1 Tax=Enterococcus wangshanyuanii TaxID=2005703 RepID=A0ABQ1P4B4_9ENTE|nr:sensor histidine kinase [Enterococcus wangshanyuanii]GGC88802.1 oxygen sensor histidine kinase NreB [Enterococcus wangshanyuanii]